MTSMNVRSWVYVSLLALAGLVSLTPKLSKAQQDSAGMRRLVTRVAPAYPALARNMALQGIVKVEVLVAPDGSVKTVDVKGGHPVLAQAAANAVRRWRWEPSAHESHEQIEVKFSPEE